MAKEDQQFSSAVGEGEWDAYLDSEIEVPDLPALDKDGNPKPGKVKVTKMTVRAFQERKAKKDEENEGKKKRGEPITSNGSSWY